MNRSVNLNSKYKLIENNYIQMDESFDIAEGYARQHEYSQQMFDKADLMSDPEFEEEQYRFYKKALGEVETKFLNTNFETIKGQQLDSSVAEIINLILTPEIDSAIKAYFNSHYAVLWYSASSWSSIQNDLQYATRWHCDGGPTKHLKTITYLDNSADHGSLTQLLNVEGTNKLKQIGYAYCNLEDRSYDISDLLEFENISVEQTDIEFEAGDTLLFNPTSCMHKAKQPHAGMVRRMFNLCIIPSPVPWNKVIEAGYVPSFTCIPFERQVRLLERVCNTLIKNNSTADEVVEIYERGDIKDAHTLEHTLALMLKDKAYARSIKASLTHANVINTNVDKLLTIVKEVLVKGTKEKDVSTQALYQQRLNALNSFEAAYHSAAATYDRKVKPVPDAVFWPIPNHSSHPANKFDMQPYVNKPKIMDKHTPIASAGSCFAFEISKALQKQGYNYVISERADDPAQGVVVDAYSPGDEHALFSANYGILFNTPSLLQLAQKAFDTKSFTKYLVQMDKNLYTDPYRENVFFRSKKAYLDDYPKHIAAIKDTLTKSEVFVFTAGLNECWQLEDNTVLSRNPKNGFHHLIKHRTLTVAENVENIKQFYYLVKQHNPDFKLVLTLSPIPLLATGRADTHHILEANTHSKAVLRVALDQVVSELKDAYYLPSYELVTECTESAWTEDHRHVTTATVDKVVAMFQEMFVKEEG